jgi:hypothetical protein
MSIIPDSKEFRQMWADGLTARVIAAHFDVPQATVSRMAIRYSLPHRDLRSLKRHRDDTEVRVAAQKKSAQARLDKMIRRRGEGKILTTNFWTYDRDLAVFQSGGAYGAVNKLAKEWGVNSNRIMARWHVLRAG